jgi:hypothetical protein
LLQREPLIDRRFEVVNARDFNFDRNAIFAGDNLLIDVGPAAAIVEFKMNLQASVRIARGAFIACFVAGQDEGVAGGRGVCRCGRSNLAIGEGNQHRKEKEA